MKKLLLNNLGLKIAALIIAIVMWFLVSAELTVRGETQRKVISDIEVGILRPSREEIVEPFKVKMNPRHVNLYIEGPKDQIADLTADNITAFVDISDFAREGIYSLPVKVILPDNIKMLSEIPICRIELSSFRKVE
jgi:YbbR domain-containing protein